MHFPHERACRECETRKDGAFRGEEGGIAQSAAAGGALLPPVGYEVLWGRACGGGSPPCRKHSRGKDMGAQRVGALATLRRRAQQCEESIR